MRAKLIRFYVIFVKVPTKDTPFIYLFAGAFLGSMWALNDALYSEIPKALVYAFFVILGWWAYDWISFRIKYKKAHWHGSAYNEEFKTHLRSLGENNVALSVIDGKIVHFYVSRR